MEDQKVNARKHVIKVANQVALMIVMAALYSPMR